MRWRRRTVDEELERWKAEREAEVEHLNAEIFKAESYLHCLRQLKDAAILCSFPGGMKVEVDDVRKETPD